MNSTESYTVQVLAWRAHEALAALEKLASKARRYGNPDITVTIGESRMVRQVITDWDGEEREIERGYTDLVITGKAPRYGNHEFLARVELTEAGNIVDTRPGVTDLDERFRHSDGYCDHCKTARKRNEVFVVRDIYTRQQLQIGRNCLHDYLGMDNPAAIAHRFGFWAGANEFEESYGNSRSNWGASLQGVMSLAAVCVRLFGWCSKAQAEHLRTESTASHVGFVLFPPPRPNDKESAFIKRILSERSDEDYALADTVIAWVRGAMPARSDYEHNLKTLCSGDDIYETKRIAVIISAIGAYQRAMEFKAKREGEAKAVVNSKHVGEIKQRLRNVRVTLKDQRVIGSNEWGDRVLIKFLDESGNLLKWITSHGSGLKVGEQALLTGTVKEHDEWNGAKETALARCVLAPVQQMAHAA